MSCNGNINDLTRSGIELDYEHFLLTTSTKTKHPVVKLAEYDRVEAVRLITSSTYLLNVSTSGRPKGIPQIRARIPSRPWLIFIGITTSLTSLYLHDRYHRSRHLAHYTTLVSHLSLAPLPPNTLPRKLTVYLSAPPGDTLRTSREYFTEYVKPILVAGGVDWDVVEGRMQGDVRFGLAERIRKHRRKVSGDSPDEEADDAPEDKLRSIRQTLGITESDEARGDIVIGRHTWKEYIRGLHEGWLGPVTLPVLSPSPNDDTIPSLSPADDSAPTDETEFDPASPTAITPDPPAPPAPKPPLNPTSPSASIPTSAYPDITQLPSSLPPTFDSSTPIPQPHLLGFLGTPVRIYRFFTRRHLVEDIARRTSAIVLASSSTPYDLSIPDPSFPPPPQQPQPPPPLSLTTALATEESDWIKSIQKPNDPDTTEKVWLDDIILDDRIAQRMRHAELTTEEQQRLDRIAEGREGVLGEQERLVRYRDRDGTDRPPDES